MDRSFFKKLFESHTESRLRDTLWHAERQRDDWKRLCSEAEVQRDDWKRLCNAAEAERDELKAYLQELEDRRDSFSGVELSLPFGGINACIDAPAQLAMRERVMLYSLVFSLGPQRVLEIGTAKGGSAQIISAALDDLGMKGELVTIDPDTDQLTVDWSALAHNSTRVRGKFPKDLSEIPGLPGALFDFVFVDGDHSYRGVRRDLEHLIELVCPDTHILLHDAFNSDVAKGIREAVASRDYVDCGSVGRVKNDSLGAEHFGGLRLLLRS